MICAVRMPELLDAELNSLGRLRAVSLRLNEQLTGLPSAVLTVLPEPPLPEPGHFVRLYTADGENGIYRVQETERGTGGVLTVRLQHGLCTLADAVLPGTHDFLGLDTNGDTGAVMTVGTVTSRKACIRSAPSGSAQILTVLGRGDRVSVTGAKRSWYAVTCGETKGWLPRACVQDTGDSVPSLLDVTQTLLNRQGSGALYWCAGEMGVTEHSGCSFTDTHVLTALLSLPDYAKYDCAWQTDQTVTPWVMTLQETAYGAPCELREGRSLLSAQITRSRSGLCTRLYPVGADGLTVADVNDGLDYVDAENAEGFAARILSIPEEQNPAALLTRARRMLERLSSPLVSMTCEAADLYPLTGEDTDRIVPGRRCLVTLPDGTRERLTVLSVLRRDVYGDPARMTVTLSSAGPQLTSLLNGARLGRERLI